MKKITLLGSTGSIGTQTLDVIAQNRDKFEVIALAAGSNIALLKEQIKQFNPKYVAVSDEVSPSLLKEIVPISKIVSIQELASIKVDLVVSAIVGYAGLLPTITAIKAGNNIALANKESIVAAGALINQLALFHNVSIIPIDSEHNALFQLIGKDSSFVEKLVITASGGPFREYDLNKFDEITVEQALKHPNWLMGKKNTIDSATLVNKVLEFIEAVHLFNMDPKNVEIFVHHDSILHGAAFMIDGSILFALSYPDMRVHIAHAMSYPERVNINARKASLSDLSNLKFYKPDPNRYPILNLLPDLISSRNSNKPIIFNAANEIAVGAFLNKQIKFTDITKIIFKTLEQLPDQEVNTIEEIMAVDQEARIKAKSFLSGN